MLALPMQAVAQEAPAPVYTVDVYDPARNPAEDLKMTVERAEAEGKRILLKVGGTWCTWCHAMDRYFHRNETVAAALAEGYLIMEVNFSEENFNEAFLGQYPAIKGYPHLFVLASDGTLLHSQDTAALEDGGTSYDEESVLDFLATWAPPQRTRADAR